MAAKETVRVVRKARVDKLKPAAGPTEEFDIKRCVVVPRASHEEGRGWVQIDGYTVLTPKGSDIRPDDQVICRGEIHSVIGKPGDFGRKGILVTLERAGRG